jgi:hypothetical protein
MNTKLIDAIAKAVLYEGYMLYPYRPSSVKNRQRFNFGVLYPRPYSEAQAGTDAWSMQTECLVHAASTPAIEVRVRFLKLVEHNERAFVEPKPVDATPAVETACSFESSRVSAPWQEAIECEVRVSASNLGALEASPLQWQFVFPAREETEVLRDASGSIAKAIDRKQESVQGVIEIKAERPAEGIFKVQVVVKNLTPFDETQLDRETTGEIKRNSALVLSLVSAHTLLGVLDGQFVSLLDPPEDLKDLATSCQNIGTWPVLVGAEGHRDTMLSSPIILYDYPQIAPESPGDLFDGTEIDEILALRIMTMTDEEKREMRSTDDRARMILERTEALPFEHLAKLHGTMRELHSLDEETS